MAYWMRKLLGHGAFDCFLVDSVFDLLLAVGAKDRVLAGLAERIAL